ncbi:hypothetical protein GMLC_27090 [Geomonas limicola]|uniref:Bacterial surface antigen (D15) domain-containing protein n=1 Tax=Geomonas limicola TaxID=2740186 RepID=A0A6V8N9L8_9BACT|nr:BamA/TamA family outer membrane protein [Geomonas limicola]GFO69130.1 hypothetical protein GMLC_27090 [Geomonas limicola]
MRSSVIAVLAALVLVCLASVSHAAHLDTSFVFSTIETPNFSVHYHQGLEPVAKKAARIAEEVRNSLGDQFGWRPVEKTQLVLIDNSDFTNGLTTALPYNAILIQVVPPALDSTIGEYDDWLKVLITHEYTHIVNLDPSRGFWRTTRGIFGKPIPGADPLSELVFFLSAPPNIFLPRWWHEGMATWAETEFNGQGRGTGSYYDMVFRMAVAQNTLPRVDQVNGDVPFWPSGNLRYLYGYRFQKFMADRYGKDALGVLNLSHAGRFPYFINGAPRQFFGRSYDQLYNDMLLDLRAEQQKKIATLSSKPFTPTIILSNRGERLTNPRFSPDGSRLAYTRRDPHDHTTVVITDRSGTNQLAEFRRLPSDGSLSWSRDGSRLYFTQAEINRGFDVYQDLYRYEVALDRVTRLTRGERLSGVDVSPDGSRFVAVTSDRGSQNLVLLERDLKPRQLTSYREERVSNPRWSPDGSSVCYALRDNAGHSSLHLYRVASGEDTTLFSAPFSVDQPSWAPDGSFIAYVSDETGVFNLFAFRLSDRKSYQVSHLLGGALQPDLAPDGKAAVFSSYQSRGFLIAELALDPASFSTERGPALPLTRKRPVDLADPATAPSGNPQEPAAPAAPAATPHAPSAAAAAAAASLTPEPALPAMNGTPYRAWPTLLPHFWLPRLTGDGSDTPVLGVFTAGADVLGYQSYALSADYSFGRDRGYFDLIYRNDYCYPTYSLLAHVQPVLYDNLQQRGDYWELDQGFTAQVSYPINFLESRYLLTGGYQFEDQSALTTLSLSGRFNGLTIFRGRRTNLFAEVSFDNALSYPYSISAEEGRTVSLTYRRFAEAFGGDLDYSQLEARYQEFLRLPFGGDRHQVLYLRLSGGLADLSQKYGQQAFQIGGIPSDLNPYPVRGYPSRSQTGKFVTTGTLEYRAPLFYPMAGPGTGPVFAEKLHGALFVDAGEVWDDQNHFDSDRLKVGIGAEARLDVTLGYWLKITPALGVAHGFRAGGENQVYFTIYVNL